MTIKLRQQLESKIVRIIVVEQGIERTLQKLYPIGTEVRVNIRFGQETPSPAIVVAHTGGRYGLVRVRLKNAKPNSRQPCRDVAYIEIV